MRGPCHSCQRRRFHPGFGCRTHACSGTTTRPASPSAYEILLAGDRHACLRIRRCPRLHDFFPHSIFKLQLIFVFLENFYRFSIPYPPLALAGSVLSQSHPSHAFPPLSPGLVTRDSRRRLEGCKCRATNLKEVLPESAGILSGRKISPTRALLSSWRAGRPLGEGSARPPKKKKRPLSRTQIAVVSTRERLGGYSGRRVGAGKGGVSLQGSSVRSNSGQIVEPASSRLQPSVDAARDDRSLSGQLRT